MAEARPHPSAENGISAKNGLQKGTPKGTGGHAPQAQNLRGSQNSIIKILTMGSSMEVP